MMEGVQSCIKFVEGPANQMPQLGKLQSATIRANATVDDLEAVFISSAASEQEGKEAFDNFMMMIYRSIIRKLR